MLQYYFFFLVFVVADTDIDDEFSMSLNDGDMIMEPTDGNAETFNCGICNETFSTSFRLIEHKTIFGHSDEEHEKDGNTETISTVNCEVCDESFSTSFGLIEHQTIFGHLDEELHGNKNPPINEASNALVKPAKDKGIL